MAEKQEVKIGKVFGDADGAMSFLVGRLTEEVDGVKKTVGAKYQLNVPKLARTLFSDEAQDAFFQAGVVSVLGNRKAAEFRESTDYGTDETAQAWVEKYSTVEGQTSALAREKKEKAEKLDDATTLTLKKLVEAQVKRVPEGTEVTKEMKAEFKKQALAWKAENHKNWVAFLKKAEAFLAGELV
jgi:hypothetical protein